MFYLIFKILPKTKFNNLVVARRFQAFKKYIIYILKEKIVVMVNQIRFYNCGLIL